jgi:hypothetical protein
MPNSNTRQIQISDRDLKIISHLLAREIVDYSKVDYNKLVKRYVKMIKEIKVVIDYYL